MRRVCIAFFLLLPVFLFAQTTTNTQGSMSPLVSQPSNPIPPEGVTIANPIPASADAASLGEYGRVPVSYFTGIPDITIPLYTIKSGDLTLPVTLSYHGGGIKVEEVASSTGLGWALNSGGVITRTVRGIADENLNGYLDPNQYVKNINAALYSQPSNLTYLNACQLLNRIAEGTYDGESDIYTFNFGSYTGQFSFTENGSIMVSPQQKISFTFPYVEGSPIASFIATTPDGVKWYFGGTSATEVTQRSGNSTNTSWFLTKVVSPSGHEIDFTYKAESYDQYQPGGSRYTFLNSTGTPATRQDDDNGTSNGLHTVKLTGITFENGNIQVYANLNRLDINPSQIPGGATMIDSLSINSTGFSKLYKLYHTNNANTRLRLDSLIGQLEPISGTNRYKKEKYSFIYNTDHWSSGVNYVCAQDWWGYYNGVFQTTLVPAISPMPGANRNPNATYMADAMLTQITYPTGGYTIFTYEPNTEPNYNFGADIGSEVGHVASGLRIQQIADYDGINASPFNVKTYKYLLGTGSSGYLNYQPQFSYNLTVLTLSGNTPVSTNYFVRTAVSNYPLATQHGSVVGYYHVEEDFDSNGQSGKTDYYYSIAGAEGVNNLGFPFAPSLTLDWHEGLLTRQITSRYASGSYLPVQQKVMVYSTINSGLSNNIKVGFNPYPYNYDPTVNYNGGSNTQGTQGTLIEQTYQNGTDYTYISSDTTWVYGSLDTTKKVKTWNNYQMDPVTYQLTRLQSLNSKRELITQSVTYPGSSSLSVIGVSNLYGSNIFTYPIEEVTTKSNADGTNLRTVKAVLTSYKTNKPFRDTVFELRSVTPVTNFTSLISGGSRDSRYQPVVSFDKYDAYGSILQEKKIADATHNYIWGYPSPNPPYNNTYPIAEVINPSADSIAYTNFESYKTNGLGNWTYNSSGTTTDITAPMGAQCYTVSSSNTIVRSNLISGSKYVVSFWSKSGAAITVTGGTLTNVATGNAKNGWIYHEYSVTGATSVTIGGTGSIDEVRLYPSTAQMSTYTYIPLVGMASKCDTKNEVTYYVYDNVGRLIQVLDQNQNVVKQYQYNYANSAQ